MELRTEFTLAGELPCGPDDAHAAFAEFLRQMEKLADRLTTLAAVRPSAAHSAGAQAESLALSLDTARTLAARLGTGSALGDLVDALHGMGDAAGAKGDTASARLVYDEALAAVREAEANRTDQALKPALASCLFKATYGASAAGDVGAARATWLEGKALIDQLDEADREPTRRAFAQFDGKLGGN